ncbi:uncharacterized protein LOC108138260 [Drosophila elegans]|uniref:uncharacterized protein LOC108138260 n=1 Tax=Drosophila elegans TaxID=30023 RepID=UPI0007E73248|nr:uncharacterized protein LOC108138260 [Drosophila elegans]XP_017115903.1 uncharacterized protein LOC108138260 [Drosophila elegans]
MAPVFGKGLGTQSTSFAQDDVTEIVSPRILHYSSSSICIGGTNNDSDFNTSSRGIVDFEKIIELDDISNTFEIEIPSTSFAARDKSFANFLLDFYMARDSKGDMHEAAAMWVQLPENHKEAYKAENYVLKLFSKCDNSDEMFHPEKKMDVDIHEYNNDNEKVGNNEVEEPKTKASRQYYKEKKPTNKLQKPLMRLRLKLKAVKKASSILDSSGSSQSQSQ